jgi:hypothetical protein
MRARRLTTPSDTPCPGIGGLALPARARIISERAGWATALLIRLKRGEAYRKFAKQRERSLAGLQRILSITQIGAHQGRSVIRDRTRDMAQKFTVAKGSQIIELTLPTGSLGARLQPVPDALEGMTARMDSRVDQSPATVAFPQEAAFAALRQR